MPQARFDTPRFRIGLTVAALWCAGAGLFYYGQYKSVQPAIIRSSYLEDLDKCELSFFPISNEEKQACANQAYAWSLKREDEERQGILYRALSVMFAPAALLLFACAFWEAVTYILSEMAAGLSRGGKSYVQWVKTGRTNPDPKSDDPEKDR